MAGAGALTVALATHAPADPIQRSSPPGLLAITKPGSTKPDAARPIQRKMKAEYSVGQTVPQDSPVRSFYPGIDLPRLNDSEGYVRADEFIFRIDTRTRVILEVIPIGLVILR